MDVNLMDLKIGLVLMKVTGLIEWSTRNKWRKYASKIYMFNIKFSSVYILGVLTMCILQASDMSIKLKLSWRLCSLGMTILQIICISEKSTLLRDQFRMPVELLRYKEILEKQLNKSLIKILIIYLSISMLLIIMAISQIYFLNISVKKSKIDIAYYVSSKLDNSILASISNSYQLLTIIGMVATIFGLDLVAIFLLLLIQRYLDHVRCLLDNTRHQMEQVDINCEEIVNLDKHRDVMHCVIVHQYIAKMVHAANEVFSTSMLFTVCRNYAMSIAAYEVTKRNESMPAILVSFLMFLFSTLQLFIICSLGQGITDRELELRDVCLRKVMTIPGRLQGDRRTLLVMAERCKSPQTISAGPFYTLGVPTFTAIVSLTFSYYTFLFSLNFH